MTISPVESRPMAARTEAKVVKATPVTSIKMMTRMLMIVIMMVRVVIVMMMVKTSLVTSSTLSVLQQPMATPASAREFTT